MITFLLIRFNGNAKAMKWYKLNAKQPYGYRQKDY